MAQGTYFLGDQWWYNTGILLDHCLVIYPNCAAIPVAIYANLTCGPGTIFNADPLFVNPDSGDFRLQPCSPARDAGSNDFLTAADSLDLAGMPRLAGQAVDMGAYELPAYGASLSELQDVLCRGDSSGWADIHSVAGCLPLTAIVGEDSLLVDSSDFRLDGLPAGNYEIALIDAQGRSDSLSLLIQEPAQEIAVTVSTSQVSCNDGIPGTASAQAVHAVPPLQWLWSDSLPDSPAQDSLPAGPYSLTLRDSLGCEASIDFFIPAKGELQLVAETVDPSCFDSHDGSIDAASVNGLPPLHWQWEQGDHTSAINGLGAGTYHLTVSDALNCRDSAAFILTAPDTLFLYYEAPEWVCDSTEEVTITAWAAGGTPPYSYLWPGGQTDSVFTGPGPWLLQVTDFRGCSRAAEINIPAAPVPVLPDTLLQPASGPGLPDGSILFPTIIGGLPPFTFLWNTGDTTLSLAEVPAGPYTLTITDSLACAHVFTFDLPFVLSSSQRSLAGQIRLFPNPAAGRVYLELGNEAQNRAAALQLYNLQGVEQRYIPLPASEISLVGLPAGAYIWRVSDETGRPLGAGRLIIGFRNK